MRTSFAGLICGLCLVLGAPGCVLVQRAEPSRVAQGRYFASGHPDYDEFFLALHRLQLEMASAPELPKRARAELARRLELNEDASPEQIAKKAQELAQRLAQQGTLLKLDVPNHPSNPADSLTLRSTPQASGDSMAQLRGGIESSATQLFRLSLAMHERHRDLERLRARGIALESPLDRVFQPEGRGHVNDVRRNLGDAQKLIVLMLLRAEEVADESDKILYKLAEAVSTDDGRRMPPSAVVGATTEKSERKPVSESLPAVRNISTPSATKSKPAPKARIKPTSSQSVNRDFEP